MVRIVLFERANRSLFSWLIFVVTGSKWTHSAIEVRNHLFDASESVGAVSMRDPLPYWGERRIRLYQIEGIETEDAYTWVQHRIGRQYDYIGIWGWLWSVHDQRKFYCFEFVWRMLAHYQYVPYATHKLSAMDIINVLGEPDYEGPAQDFKGDQIPCL